MLKPSLLKRCVGSVLGQFREPLARLRAEWVIARPVTGESRRDECCRVEVLEDRQLMSGTGSLDLNFGGTGIVFVDVASMMDLGQTVAVQEDGKVLAGGMAELADGSRYGMIVRFNPDGSRDVSFGQGGLLLMPASTTGPSVGQITSLLVLDDGTILASGIANVNGFYGRAGMLGADAFAAVRIHSDGTLDASFGNGGVAVTDFSLMHDHAHRIALDPFGRVVLVGGVGTDPGSRDYGDFGVARFNADGTPDLSFSGDGKATVNFTYAALGGRDAASQVAFGPGGTILLGGWVENYVSTGEFPERGRAFARLTNDGGLDASFGVDGRVTDSLAFGLNALLMNADGSFVALGTGSNVANQTGVRLARYHADGALDAGFGPGGTTYLSADVGSRYSFHLTRLQGGGFTVAGAGNDGAFAAVFDANGVPVSSATVSSTTIGGSVSGLTAALTDDGKLVFVGIWHPAGPTYDPDFDYNAWHNSADVFVARYELVYGAPVMEAMPDPRVLPWTLPPAPEPEPQPEPLPEPLPAPEPDELSAVMTGKAVVRRGRAYRFTVTYAAPAGTSFANFDAAALQALSVSGPNGFTADTRTVRVKCSKDGMRLRVRYLLDAPGGRFDPSDNGVYAVVSRDGVSASGAPRALLSTADGATLGAFRVQAKVPVVVKPPENPGADDAARVFTPFLLDALR